MFYSLDFSKQALKELVNINEPYYSQIKQAIFSLTQNPRPNGYKKLKGRNGYRIRIGNYRVIYDIFDSKLLIEIVTLGHRKNIYD